MRVGGMGRDVLTRLGVDAILTPPGEIAAAMASGRLDAVEWNGPWNDRDAGLHKLAPYYYMPGVLEIGPMLEASINKGVFASLSSDLQEVIRRATAASAFETYCDFTYHNAVHYEILLKDGVQMRTFPADVVRAKAQATEAILQEIAQQSDHLHHRGGDWRQIPLVAGTRVRNRPSARHIGRVVEDDLLLRGKFDEVAGEVAENKTRCCGRRRAAKAPR
jgi:TRAP-type mannitol/chloroaromatic compound transport system substrate-binding protein